MTKRPSVYRPKDTIKLAKYICDLATGEIEEKSAKVPPKKSKSGIKYVVLEDLPQDQQDAWKTITKDPYSCLLLEGDRVTPNYHDYTAFYEAWTEGKPIAWD